ncbi:hypothetical protein D3C77_268140 [compost metagenome]
MRHAGGQAQAACVVAQGSLLDQCGQLVAGLWAVWVEFTLSLELDHVDAQLLEQIEGQAGFYSTVIGVAIEIDIATTDQHFVAVQVDSIITRQYAIGGQQQLQVDV